MMKAISWLVVASALAITFIGINGLLRTNVDTDETVAKRGRIDAPATGMSPGAPVVPANPSEETVPAPVNINPDTQKTEAIKQPVWDLCGVGTLPIPEGGSALADGKWASLPKHLGEEAQDNARERVLLSLSQGDPRARAAGLLLRLRYAQRFARTELEVKAAAEALPQTQEALLALATGSRDPVVASWAVSSCREDINCRREANAVWRQLEPDNATPWMVELDLAPENSTSALSAVARSSRYSVYPGLIVGTALSAMPSDIPLYLQQRLLNDISIMEDTFTRRHATRVPNGALYNLCISTTDSTGQAASSQATPQAADCRAIAQLFSERSDALDSHLLGLNLSRSSGSPAAELEERLEQAKLLRAASVLAPVSQPYACATVERSRAMVRDTASRGEMNALRALAAEGAALTAKREGPR